MNLIEKILIAKSKYLVLLQTESEYFFILCKDDPSRSLNVINEILIPARLGKVVGKGVGYAPKFAIRHFKKEYGALAN